MSTINHTIKHLNQDETGYDTYHIETNTEQVYDFDSGKWLNEIIAELKAEIRAIAISSSEEINLLKLKIEQLEITISEHIDNSTMNNHITISDMIPEVDEGVSFVTKKVRPDILD